jgi:hypothetical protein
VRQPDRFPPERPPFRPQSATSRAAATGAAPRVGNQRERIYRWLLDRPAGGTSDEWYAEHGDRHTALGTRLKELERLGLVERRGTREGRRGNACDVFRAIPADIGPDTFKAPPSPPSAREGLNIAAAALHAIVDAAAGGAGPDELATVADAARREVEGYLHGWGQGPDDLLDGIPSQLRARDGRGPRRAADGDRRGARQGAGRDHLGRRIRGTDGSAAATGVDAPGPPDRGIPEDGEPK